MVTKKTSTSVTSQAVVIFLSACGPRPVDSPIAFSSGYDGDGEIYVINPEGSGQINLTNDPSTDRFPTCSPDGARIAFTSAWDDNLEIHVMNADGNGVTRLTDPPGDDADPTWSARRDGRGATAGNLACLWASLLPEPCAFASTPGIV